jgi:hypothetical protein
MKKDDVNGALAAAYMEKDKMTIPYSPVVVNTGSKLVAIDTGTGEANFERSKGTAGAADVDRARAASARRIARAVSWSQPVPIRPM